MPQEVVLPLQIGSSISSVRLAVDLARLPCTDDTVNILNVLRGLKIRSIGADELEPFVFLYTLLEAEVGPLGSSILSRH
jgi:hypothetical protein